MKRTIQEDNKGLYLSVGGWIIRPTQGSSFPAGTKVIIAGGLDPTSPYFGQVIANSHRERWAIRNSETAESRRAIQVTPLYPRPTEPGLYVYDVVSDHEQVNPRGPAYEHIDTNVVAVLDQDGEEWLIELSRGFPRISHRERNRPRKLAIYPEASNAVIFRTVDWETRP